MGRNGEGTAMERKYLASGIGAVDGAGVFSGYASLFGVPDLGGDVVEPGAFAASLARRGASSIRMLYQHDPAVPIGTWLDVREDARGLLVRGRLATGASKARDVHALMKNGALDGLSIGFRTIRDRRDPRTGLRHVLEADLWEVSIVTFPMLPNARIGNLKSRRSPLNEGERDIPLAAVIRAAARRLNPKERQQ